MRGRGAPGPPREAGGRLRVLVVDDQPFIRMALRRIIDAEADMTVVGEAGNGLEAVAMASQLRPDVVTMDLEMPLMDGCEATAAIMRQLAPAPAIIMVSSHTRLGAEATLRSLRNGAVDFISKTSLQAADDFERIGVELRLKLRAWAGTGAQPRPAQARQPSTRRPSILQAPSSPAAPPAAERPLQADLVVVASSTGGPQALTRLFTAVRRIAVPVVVAQHMPSFFTASLARLLMEDTGIPTREGRDGEVLQPGTVTILPGGCDGLVARGPGGYRLRLVTLATSPHPSANALFEAAAISAGAPVAVVLTGMGDDGTRGAAALRRRNAPVIVQTPETCVVAGMPTAVIEAGAATHVCPIERIAELLAAARPTDATCSRGP